MKPKIVTIGTLVQGRPVGWVFDYSTAPSTIPGYYTEDDGTFTYSGYTRDELEAISLADDILDAEFVYD